MSALSSIVHFSFFYQISSKSTIKSCFRTFFLSKFVNLAFRKKLFQGSYWECARTHRVLGRFYEEATGSRLAFPSMGVGFMTNVSASGKHAEQQRYQLQTWLDNVLSVSNPQCHSAVWRLLGYPSSRQEVTDTPLANIPLIDCVTGFLDHPKDIASLCAVNQATWNTMRPHLDQAWKICLQCRWPGIHDALVTNLENLDWRQAWRQILSGGEILMGVHERQLKRGFAMSCMPAWISWDKTHKAFRVVYLSGLTMTPTEYIGWDSFDRLAKMRGDPYAAFPSDLPENFQPGDACAVQWKMLRNGPFGWWYGTIHNVFRMNGQWHADVRFTHIVNDSRWHALIIPIGNISPNEAQSGGFTGGIIKVEKIFFLKHFDQNSVQNLRSKMLFQNRIFRLPKFQKFRFRSLLPRSRSGTSSGRRAPCVSPRA